MANLIATLHRKRGNVKHRLTAVEIYYNEISGLATDQITQENLSVIKSRLKSLVEIWASFKSVQDEIEEICEEDDLDDEYKERDEFETRFHLVTAKLNDLIVKPEISNQHETDVQSHTPARMQNIPNFDTHIKLPIISLPKFNGAHTDWLEFKCMFEDIIHTNTHITNVQKFHYLRASLIGNAAKAILKPNISSDNYDTVWDILCKRYENKDLLIHEHIKAIFELQNTTANDSKSFRNIIDEVNKHLKYLETLGDDSQQRDALLTYIITNKLDKSSLKEWEEYLKNNEKSSLDNLEQFLLDKAEVFEKLEQRTNKLNLNSNNTRDIHKRHGFLSTQTPVRCKICKKEHYIYKCQEFLDLTPQQRFERVKSLKLCSNCLRTGHMSQNCNSSNCRKCGKPHNTLLHFEQAESKVNQVVAETMAHVSTQNVLEETMAHVSTQNVLASHSNLNHYVLLSTVCFSVMGKDGIKFNCRALLDNGSQSNFMTYSFFKKLGLQQATVNISVVGVGNVFSNIKHRCNVQIESHDKQFKTKINCFLINQICDNIPNFEINYHDIHIPKNVKLADPDFYESAGIDMLIGAELFWQLLKPERIELGKNLPLLQNSALGWIVTGVFNSSNCKAVSQCNLSIQTLHEDIQKFWAFEENYSNKTVLTADEQQCESLFQRDYTRKPNGQFVVSIPFKKSPETLGNSSNNALQRFKSLERKLLYNQSLKEQYVQFMAEYVRLGHMSKLTKPVNDTLCYYLPHHAVLKSDSLTTKCRVVFDGSTPTDNGLSLNNIQHIGSIQDDLFSILIRFREHAIVFSADICKMYRQIEITPDQRKFQRIFWRENPSQNIEVFELCTVTYGFASAPFLATRCVKQLAIDFKHKYPLASKIISRDFYIDDLIAGSNTIAQAVELINQITFILNSGCFTLTKWCSNNSAVLASVDDTCRLTHYIDVGEKTDTKLLGLQWDFNNDSLRYHINYINAKQITKRSILSIIAKTFDPLGLLAPSIMSIKFLLQELWSLHLGWDDDVPENIKFKWLTFKSDLENTNEISIPRFAFCTDSVILELHGFSDASQQGYGACIYTRAIGPDNSIKRVSLICAKGRVAPLKTLTIPRLELCGAVILAQLMEKVRSSITVKVKCFYWTDSKVVLSWIKNHSRLFHIFVANRIAEIQNLTSADDWFHVKTHENPADLISRGMQISELKQSKLWWEGPSWLCESNDTWKESVELIPTGDLPETKVQVNTVLVTHDGEKIISKFSSLTRLKRVIAFCIRFKQNSSPNSTTRINHKSNVLTVNELDNALKTIIKMSQNSFFQNEINNLRQQNNLPPKNRLKQFSPFLDVQGILRVGGRIQNANLQFDQTHPILLSSKSRLSRLLLTFEHLRNYHTGPQHLLYISRQKFWIIGGRSLAKQIVRSCIQCFRTNPKGINPIMGNLPSARVQMSHPFTHTGTDFAGPFLVRERKGRGIKKFKCYLCVFVCMCTRAIHLEILTDLTTDSFLQSFRRFIARRGQPTNVYSDNGRTFVKASKDLHELGKFLQNSQGFISENMNNRSINWHFIPAYSPNFGGLWEAGVKSTKFHLKRVLANASVTLMEFITIISEIEGILNSRPIAPMSNDPTDLEPLSPGHFLIGRPITSIVEPNCMEIQPARLSNYKRLEQIRQHFWSRWYKEYITELQLRYKWKNNVDNIQTGSLVLIKDNNLPPLCWRLGRIIEVHPGSDGVVRVVTIKTSSSVIKRATTQVCVLPVEAELTV